MDDVLTAWQSTATAHLLALQNPDGGWPHRPASASATEPTALAALALSAAGAGPAALPAAADWLAARQQSDGLFTASAAHHDASWLTPLAALALARLGRTAPAAAAAEALLAEPVYTMTQLPTGTYGYDTTLKGWPWTVGGFSFTEPTALAIVFLKQQGHTGADRVREGVSLLRNRALADGGWNYGEPEVLGGRLFPTDAPTAMALLALADEQDNHTAAARDWLLGRQGQISSLYSLGWAATAINTLGLSADAWMTDVVTIWNTLPAERRDPVGTSLCLLGTTADHPFAVGSVPISP